METEIYEIVGDSLQVVITTSTVRLYTEEDIDLELANLDASDVKFLEVYNENIARNAASRIIWQARKDAITP